MHSIVVCAFQIWMPINSSGWVATPTMYSLSHSEKKNALNICLCLSDLNACWLKWLSGNSYSVYYLISYVTDPIYIPIYILLDLIHENIDLEKSSTPFEGAIIREKNDDTFVSEDLTWACFTDWSMHLPLLSLWKKNTLLGFELTALIWYMFAIMAELKLTIIMQFYCCQNLFYILGMKITCNLFVLDISFSVLITFIWRIKII